jgi:hypothetical protein
MGRGQTATTLAEIDDLAPCSDRLYTLESPWLRGRAGGAKRKKETRLVRPLSRRHNVDETAFRLKLGQFGDVRRLGTSQTEAQNRTTLDLEWETRKGR